MLNKKLIVVVSLLLISVAIFADVPPPIDEMRVNPPMQFTPTEDFSDYRFFLKSPIDIEEIEVKKDKIVKISGENRGGAKIFGTLIAIPKSSLKEVPKPLNSGFVDVPPPLSKENTAILFNAVQDNKVKGVIEILKHSFCEDIKKSERPNWKYPTYTLKRDGNSIKAVVKDEIAEKMSDEEEAEVNLAKYVKATIIGGILIMLAVVLLGIYLFRRSKK